MATMRGVFLEGAPSDKHEEIKRLLDGWALGLDFPVNVARTQSIQPDVLRRRQSTALFMGDAKVSANETPQVEDTAERISKYVDWFREQLRSSWVSGMFAIGTDDAGAASEWVEFLNLKFGQRVFKVSLYEGIWIAHAKLP